MSSSTLLKFRRKIGPLVTARPSTSRLHNRSKMTPVAGSGGERARFLRQLVGLQSHRGHLGGFTMQMLIVGIGALGGTIAARALRAGLPVRLAARDTESAEVLRRSGLRVSGIGGEVEADTINVAALEDYGKGTQFDLILLATKAQHALEVAPQVVGLLAPEGVILPIQNGGVARVLADRLGEEKILCGFSNFVGTVVEPGVYEQKNAGPLVISR